VERAGRLHTRTPANFGWPFSGVITTPHGVSPETIKKLNYYDFPGNETEFRNLIERASILSVGSELNADNFPEQGIPLTRASAS
jgi:DNA-binding NtrC family response regulator